MLIDALTSIVIAAVERGLPPDALVRAGVRHLLRQRRREIAADDPEAAADISARFIAALDSAPIAHVPEQANAQHYEIPAEFFARVLGARRKYSSCYWPQHCNDLDAAENAALALTCEHAQLRDGQTILELGCGWGSLSLWMAEKYPRSQITAVSNSHSQRAFIEREAAQRRLDNLNVITADMNGFACATQFDRIVSVEMFEHMRNWPELFRRVGSWLRPDGRFFMHVFAHRSVPYAFVARDSSDWMSRYFFSGGMMPSDDLALHFQRDLQLVQRWRWNGHHYARTLNAWLEKMDRQRAELRPLFDAVYGSAQRDIWWQRWRLFFIASAELFAYNGGSEWWVSHYLFERRG